MVASRWVHKEPNFSEYSHREKVNAKAKQVKEQAREIKEKFKKQKKLSLWLLLGVNGF